MIEDWRCYFLSSSFHSVCNTLGHWCDGGNVNMSPALHLVGYGLLWVNDSGCWSSRWGCWAWSWYDNCGHGWCHGRRLLHPWKWLVRLYRLFHPCSWRMGRFIVNVFRPWNWGMRRFNGNLVLRCKNILHALLRFHVHFVLAVGCAVDGLNEVTVSLNDCICWCHCWLCQVFVFKIDRATDSCPSCCLHK